MSARSVATASDMSEAVSVEAPDVIDGIEAHFSDHETPPTSQPTIHTFTILCSWHQRTKSATLTFRFPSVMLSALQTLQNASIDGRRIHCHPFNNPKQEPWNHKIHIRNLNLCTSPRTLYQACGPRHGPFDLTFNASLDLQNMYEAASEVQYLLSTSAELSHFDILPLGQRGEKCKAIATLSSLSHPNTILNALNSADLSNVGVTQARFARVVIQYCHNWPRCRRISAIDGALPDDTFREPLVCYACCELEGGMCGCGKVEGVEHVEVRSLDRWVGGRSGAGGWVEQGEWVEQGAWVEQEEWVDQGELEWHAVRGDAYMIHEPYGECCHLDPLSRTPNVVVDTLPSENLTPWSAGNGYTLPRRSYSEPKLAGYGRFEDDEKVDGCDNGLDGGVDSTGCDVEEAYGNDKAAADDDTMRKVATVPTILDPEWTAAYQRIAAEEALWSGGSAGEGAVRVGGRIEMSGCVGVGGCVEEGEQVNRGERVNRGEEMV